MINDEEVRNFITSFFLAEERGDVEYTLSEYGDSFGGSQSGAIRRPGDIS